MKNILLASLLIISLSACEVLQQLGGMAIQQPLTSTDVANGLKQALALGADSAVVRLSKKGGYYLDKKTRIHLPAEAKTIIDNMNLLDFIKVECESTLQPLKERVYLLCLI